MSFLLSLLAWAEWLAECAVWPTAAIAGIVGGTATYRLREALYEAYELPLYNLWLSLHTYLSINGYVMPVPGETNAGLTTLGLEVSEGWAATIAALGTPDGGVAPATPGPLNQDFPRDVVVDPPNFITAIFADLFKLGAPEINGQYPSEFTRPWRFPWTDNQGHTVNVERPQTFDGPFQANQNALALLGGMAGSDVARHQFEIALSEQDTLAAAATLLPGAHLGDAVDYSSYLVVKLTRDALDPTTVANFNLDADRGYGYLCWDWKREPLSRCVPDGFRDKKDPLSHLPTDIARHVYRAPLQPGYGWDAADQDPIAGVTPATAFNPDDPQASVVIRYIDHEPK